MEAASFNIRSFDDADIITPIWFNRVNACVKINLFKNYTEYIASVMCYHPTP